MEKKVAAIVFIFHTTSTEKYLRKSEKSYLSCRNKDIQVNLVRYLIGREN